MKANLKENNTVANPDKKHSIREILSLKNTSWRKKLFARRAVLPIAFIFIFAALGITTLLLTRAASVTGQIKNSNGKCLDNKRNLAINSNPVQIYTCNGGVGQSWTIPGDGTIRVQGKCLDAKRAGKTPGTPVQIYACHGGLNQKWTINSTGTIVNVNANLCLDNKRALNINSNPVQLYTCHGGLNQKWTVPSSDPDPGDGGPTVSWPTTAPAQICSNNSILGGGPASAPTGAITVPAGNNSSVDFGQDNKIYWFAPGVHTLGTGQYSQIGPGDNSTYVGAPGAIIDGQSLNNYAFSGESTNVTIRYLTIRNFKAPRDEGVVNHDAGDGWTIEYSTITNNKGAGLMGGKDNTYRYNCIKDNGQYGINSCCGGDSAATDIQNFVLDHNEITGNNTDDWESKIEGCGCTGGVKFWLNKDVTVTNNWVHNNHGVGLWMDNNNRGVLIEQNYINDNDGFAVMAEAGYDFQVRYNNMIGNGIVEGRVFATRSDPFPTGAIYISESGSPTGYGVRYVPSVISYNNFDNNWGGVNLWENPDRYSGSSAHTHVSGTIKIGSLYDDTACNGANDTIPAGVGDKFKCRWSTENVIVEHNTFRIDKAAIGGNCTVGSTYCGISGIFSGAGTYPEFSGFLIPWRITYQQGNIFRNNTYKGDWKFAGWETSNRTNWNNWRAPAPAVPSNTDAYNPPSTFGQDAGSTYTSTP